MNQLQSYLKQTLTPIVEHVFKENRSIKTLFSAIDYAPIKRVRLKFFISAFYILFDFNRIINDFYYMLNIFSIIYNHPSELKMVF